MNGKITLPTTALPDKVERRREQLRVGQRAHRERKNRRVEDLEARVRELEATVLNLEGKLRSARTPSSSSSSTSLHSLSDIIIAEENVTLPPSTSVFPLPLDLVDPGAVEAPDIEHPSPLRSPCVRGFSFSSYDSSGTLVETTGAQDARLFGFELDLAALPPPTIPAILLTSFLALHQRLEYRTVQRTLEYALTYDLASLNRLFMFHLSDPSTRHWYEHPGADEANRLLGTVLLRGDFAFDWPPVVIPSAEKALARREGVVYMDARQVEGYLRSAGETYTLCLSLRADEFVASLSRLAVCFGRYGPCFMAGDVVECAKRISW